MAENDTLTDDLHTIELVLGGQREAFSALVLKYQQQLLVFCSWMLGSSAAGEDAAQEVFLKAFERLRRFRAEAPFRSWLLAIARNHCLDELRKRQRRRESSLEAITAEYGDAAADLIGHTSACADAVADQLLVAAALRELPEQYRDVIVLRELQELGYEEIAAVLEVSLEAVRAKLRRARLELIKVLETLLAEEERH